MRGPFGNTLPAPWLRRSGFGAVITTDQQLELLREIETTAVFAEIRDLIDRAALEGAEVADIEEAQAAYDELSASLDRLIDRSGALEPSDIEVWRAEAARIHAAALSFRDRLRDGLGTHAHQRVVKVGLWVAGASVLTIGGVLWLRSRKKRRR